MKKIQVLADPFRKPFCSTDIIVSNLNNAAKKSDIYSDNECNIVYDCIGNKHGHKTDALIIVYEMIFPKFILNNSWPKPIFGVSRDNLSFILEADYPKELSGYFHLGVDSNLWQYKEKKENDKFIFLGIGECNTRGGLELIVSYFCEEFSNSKNIILYLRDRDANDIFKNWVKNIATQFNVTIIHDDRHLTDHEEEKKIYYQADAAICLNKSSTWNLRTIECMSTGTPLIVIPYGGPRDYTSNNESALHVEFDLEKIISENFSELSDIGLRNHLFDPQIHAKSPVWAIPKRNSVRDCMRKILEDKQLRTKLSVQGADEAKKYSWENSATQLYKLINNYT